MRTAARASACGPPAISTPVDLLARLGRREDTDSWPRIHVEDPAWQADLVELSRSAGRDTAAERVREYGIEPGGATASPRDLPTW